RRELPDLIREIGAETDRRLEANTANGPAIYLLIHGLQRARDLRPEEDAFLGGFSPSGFSLSIDDSQPAPPPPSPSTLLPKILREGPDLGIHTIVWCNTLANFERTLDRTSMREFDMRVVFQMP